MKKPFLNKKKTLTLLAISSLALLSGCGSSQNNNSAAVIPGGVANPYGVGGCVPITTTTQIPFIATGMYFGTSTDARVMAGQIPYKTTYGQVVVGGVDPSAGLGTAYGQYRGQRVDGTTISLNLTSALNGVGVGTTVPGFGTTPGYNSGYGAAVSGNASASGYIQVSAFIQQLLVQAAASAGYGTTYGGIGVTQPGLIPGQYSGQTACVSGLAIDLQHTISSNWLYLGSIYFYLNGTQHGMALDF